MTKNKEIGTKGEQDATEYLKNKGYLILAINLSNKYGEIDIIAEYNEVVIFVEVKSLTMNYVYKPEDHLDKRKRLALRRTINYIIEKNMFKRDSDEIRFDLITLTYNDTNCIINHYENVEL